MSFLKGLREYLREREYKPLWHALCILLITVASWGLFYTHFFSRGTLMYIDMSFPTSVGRNLELYNHMWWQYGSVMNIWNVQRLFWSYPLLIFCKLFGLSNAVYLFILFSGTLATAGISMYILAYSLLRSWGLGRKSRSSLFIGSILAAVIYMYNPWSLAHLWPYFGYPGYALLPVAFLLLKKAVDKRSTGYTIALGVVISVASTGPICVVWFWLMIITYLFFDLALRRFEKKRLLANLKALGTTLVIYAAIGMIWILPYLYSQFANKTFTPSYVPEMTQSALDTLSAGNTIANNIRLISGWGMPFDMNPTNWFWTILSFALVLFSILGFVLLLKKRTARPSAVYWASVSVVAVIVATGSSSVIKGVYSYLVLRAPKASSYGWLLRSSDRWLVYVPVFYGLMCAYLLARLIEGRVPARRVLSVVIIGLLIASLVPVTLNFARNVFNATEIPEDYNQANRFIEKEAGKETHVLWTPFYRDGFKFYWAPYKRIGAFYAYSSNPNINNLQNPYVADSYFYWLNDLLSRNAALGDAVITEHSLMLGNDITARLMAPFAPVFLIYDNSIPDSRYGNILKEDNSLEIAERTKWLDIYTLSFQPDHIRAATSTVLANDFYDNLSVTLAMTPEHLAKMAFIDDDTVLDEKYGAISLMDHLEPVSRNSGFEEFNEYGYTAHWIPEDFSKGPLMHTDSSTKREGELSLRVINRDAYDLGINWIQGAPVSVEPGSVYVVESSVKYSNSEWTNVVVEGHKPQTGEWVRLVYCPTIGDGTSEWEDHQCSFYVPDGIDSVRVRLGAGWVKDTTKGPAISWFDNVKLSKVGLSFYLEMVLRGDPPSVTTTQISPEKYEVKVKGADKPFVLVMSEAFDPMWEASVEGGDTVDAIPLYNTINGFPIEKTGSYTIVIEYASQKWFTLGLIISLLSLILCFACLLYCWEKETGAPGMVRERISHTLKPAINAFTRSIKRHKTIYGMLFILLSFALIWVLVSFSAAFFTVILLACLLWNIDSRYPLGVSLFLLAMVPVLMVLGENGLSDLFAIWTFLLLVISVFLKAVRYIRSSEKD